MFNSEDMEIIECHEVTVGEMSHSCSVFHQIAEKLRQALGRFPVM